MINYINLGLEKIFSSSAVLSAGNALLEDKIHVTMGEALKITVFSMLLVFLILLIISYIVDIMKVILDKKSNKKVAEKAPAVIKQTMNTLEEVEEVEEDDNTELVAVIMAAIEAYGSTSSKGLVVRNIKKVSTNDSVWTVAGKSNLLK